MQQFTIMITSEGPDAIANALALVAQRISDGRSTGAETMPDGTQADYTLYHVPPTAEARDRLDELAHSFQFNVGMYGREHLERVSRAQLCAYLPITVWVQILGAVPVADAAHVLAVLFHPTHGLPAAARECLALLTEDEAWGATVLGAADAAGAPITVRWLASILTESTTA